MEEETQILFEDDNKKSRSAAKRQQSWLYFT